MPPRPTSVAEHVSDPRHAGPLAGAPLVGEAAGSGRLLVQIGIWREAAGHPPRARFRATTCASLIAYAEAACALVEAGVDLSRIDAERLRGAVSGVHPIHHDRAELVALALRRALAASDRAPSSSHPPPKGAEP